MSHLLRIWKCVGIERFVPSTRGLVGRPPRERVALVRAFVAKAVLGLSETSALVERLNANARARNAGPQSAGRSLDRACIARFLHY